MNEKQEIDGQLYERVPATSINGCKGCAFRATKTNPCGLLGSEISCTEPSWVIFVAVRPSIQAEPDEQCGVGNG